MSTSPYAVDIFDLLIVIYKLRDPYISESYL
jgi:hypothetical protein